MKTKKTLLSMAISIASFLLLTNKALAAETCLIEIGNDCLTTSGHNTANTAEFDAATSTLTLNNFEGSHIKFTPTEDKTLKILLKGTSNITDSMTIPGIDSNYGITIQSVEGEKATLNLESLERGINSSTSDVTIENVNLKIKNTSSNAILSGSNLKIQNSNVTIENAGKIAEVSAIYGEGNITIESNINISDVKRGIESFGNFVLNKGKVIVEATDMGILSYSAIKLNGGYVEATVEDNGTSIAALGIDETPVFDYKDTMIVSPSDASIQTSEIEDPPATFVLKALGYDGFSFDLDLKLTSAPSHVIIQDTYKIEYNPNGGNGSMEGLIGQTGVFTLPENEFTAPTGKKFKGWSLTPNGDLITSLELTEDVTFYAIWEEIPTTTTTTKNNKVEKKELKEENPSTGDNILLYTIVGFISFATLATGTIYFRKNN